MDFSLILAFFVVVLAYTVKKWSSQRNGPPGPWGLPYIGSLLHLARKENIFAQFEIYKKKYGNIFSVRLGNFDVIVLNDYRVIQEAFKRDELLGRPDFEIWKVRNDGVRNRGILACDANKTWTEQRRFTLRVLRDYGFGKQGVEPLLTQELQELTQHLRKQVGVAVSLDNAFNASVLNSLWYMIAGRRFELDDPECNQMIELVATNLQNAQIAGPGLLFPEPAKYNLVKRGLWKKLVTNAGRKLQILKKEVDGHLESYDEDNQRDYIDSYIKQMKNSSPGSSFHSDEGRWFINKHDLWSGSSTLDTNLLVVMNDLFVAGSETTSTTLLWGILYLTLNPKVQTKIQVEIDTVIGRNRLPMKSDKPKMVYVEAFLNEVHRHCSLLPLSVYHSVLRDTEIGGYFCKAGSLIYANLYEAHHNIAYWKDPQNFRPERFLAESGAVLIKHEPFMPFSTGKRICLGESLARDTLFFFLTGMLQLFTFELDIESCENISKMMEPASQTMVLRPKPFKVIIRNREGIK